MSIKKFTFAALAAAALTTAAPMAQAATVTLDYEGKNAFGDPNWSRVVSYDLNGKSQRSYAGMFRVVDTAEPTQSILAFCIDLFQRLKLPTSHDTSVTVANAAQLDNIGKLYSTAYDSVDSRDTAAAFQLALWEIMTDTDSGLDLEDGNFKATGSGLPYDLAAGYLRGMSAGDPSDYTLTTFYSATSQDLVTGELSPVPLPASALMLLAGVGGLVGMRRRKKS